MKLGGPGAAEHPLPRPVGSGRGPKGTEGSQAAHSRVFISGDHTALTNLSRNIQVLPGHSFMALKLMEIYMQMRCSPPALGNLPWQPLLLPPSSSSFMGKPSVIPQHRRRRRISLHELHKDGPAHCCPTPSKGILLPALGWLIGSFSSLLSNCRNWISRIKTTGCFGTEIQRSHVCAGDNPWIKNRV